MKTYDFSYHLPISRLHHIGKTKRISRRFLLIPTDCFTIPGSTPKRKAVGSNPAEDAMMTGNRQSFCIGAPAVFRARECLFHRP